MTRFRHEQHNGAPRPDALLDVLLEEVLGGQTPPDLSNRILQGLESTHQDPTAMRCAQEEVVDAERPIKPTIANGHAPQQHRRSMRTKSNAMVRRFAIAGGTIAVIGVVVLLVARTTLVGRPSSQTALDREILPHQPEERSFVPSQAKSTRSQIAPTHPADPTLSPKRSPEFANAPSESVDFQESEKGFSDLPPFATSSPHAIPSSQQQTSDYSQPAARTMNDADVIAYIDHSLETSWAESGVSPSPPALDGEWARRSYLRILGRIPTYQELTAFLDDPATNRREELIDKLLFDDQLFDEYADHWAGVWTNLLIGRSGGLRPDDLADREGLEHYLREEFRANSPYDRIVFELVSATGSNRPGTEDYNGAVNFLLGNWAHNHTLATAKSARVFLARQVHCAQCHNHPFGEWTQEDFWEFNAFFHQMAVIRDADRVRLVDQDFPGETGDIAAAEIYFDRLDGVRKSAYPTFLDNRSIASHGAVEQVNRRRELGKFLTTSRDLSQALVNRMWSHFFGYGFVSPIDDLRPGNPPSHPELLEFLSDQFIAHEYDVKRLVFWLASTKAFSLSSRISPQNRTDSPESGASPMFSRYYTRQMNAEQLYDSLTILAAQSDPPSPQFHALKQSRAAWLSQFSLDLDTDEGDEFNTFNGTIPQALALMNGELTQQTIVSEQGVFQRILRSSRTADDKLERLFLSALSRRPTKREVASANRLLATHQGKLDAAFEDLWWALLNSNEFILDH
jgi:hypothetical protein